MNQDIAIALYAMFKGIDYDKIMDFIINNMIDNYIVSRLPDYIRNCVGFIKCMNDRTMEDYLNLFNNAWTSMNALDCMAETFYTCFIKNMVRSLEES